jgi:hypothetical protein
MNKRVDTTAQTTHPQSYLTFQDILETVSHEPGQGRLLDQIEKILRVQQPTMYSESLKRSYRCVMGQKRSFVGK